MRITPVFTDFISTQSLDDINNEALIEYINAIANKDNYVELSNRGGFQSKPLLPNESEELDKLVHLIEENANKIAREMGFQPLVCCNVWANINPKYAYNNVHHHPLAVMSGVYYPRALPNQGNIVFERGDLEVTYLGRLTSEEYTPYTSVTLSKETRTSDLIFFPSYLKHKVEPNLTDIPRISIAFNLDIAGIPK